MVAFDDEKNLAEQKAKMIASHLRARDITDPAVLEIMAKTPREEFILDTYKDQAYADNPLPIGLGQTISQPYIVALMTQCLHLNKDCSVLELGTGSGYQTAILASLARTVCTIERHNQLIESAQNTLDRLGFNNIEYLAGDGSNGWPDFRTFDRIIITAAAGEIPLPVIDQLADPGKLVAPIGGEFSQTLMLYEKQNDILTKTNICGCRFVKLIGDHGFQQ
ncbi:MAG: protein-L-isoaspartate(D-aspartate) O-methyltransferase [Planctomycetes bacterium]|nr:protein-L-isoaspartate(D-aspartate) O-methyltransferase [Planctomycetota bacterium]